jgi:hypothetical protein
VHDTLSSKGLQERKTTIEWDNGGKTDNKNKLFIIAMFITYSNLYLYTSSCPGS